MEEEYVKEVIIKDKTENEKNIELIKSIIKTRIALNEAHNNFNFAEDDMIDYYSYQIKANESKLDYLTKLAKVNNLSLESINNVYDNLKMNKNKAG